MTEAQVAHVQRLLATVPEIEAAYLFGSQATGKIHGGSDYDFAMMVDQTNSISPTTDLRLRIIGLLADALGTDKIDAVIFHEISTILKYQILLHGQRVYERAGRVGRDEEAKAILEYFDFEPMYEMTSAGFLRRVRNFAHGQ